MGILYLSTLHEGALLGDPSATDVLPERLHRLFDVGQRLEQRPGVQGRLTQLTRRRGVPSDTLGQHATQNTAAYARNIVDRQDWCADVRNIMREKKLRFVKIMKASSQML